MLVNLDHFPNFLVGVVPKKILGFATGHDVNGKSEATIFSQMVV